MNQITNISLLRFKSEILSVSPPLYLNDFDRIWDKKASFLEFLLKAQQYSFFFIIYDYYL